MVVPESQLQYIVRNPISLLVEAHNNNYSEEEWKQIYTWLNEHRMTDELHALWLHSQIAHGKWRFRALGQMYARFATIGKGFSTVDNATRHKIKKIRDLENEVGKN